MRLLSSYYNNIVTYDFIIKFNNNKPSVPKFSKLVLSLNTKNDSLINLVSSSIALELITNQKTKYILRKVPQNLNIKVKFGVPTGCTVTLRRGNLLNLLTNLFITNPEYTRLNAVSFRRNGRINVSFGINNFSSFKLIEKNYYLFRELRNINVSLITNSIDYNIYNFLLTSFKLLRGDS
jgi:ribosomal protein L5